MTRSGWYPDPTGRYPRRWHDGYDWTASVIDNEGQQGYDALPAAAAPVVPALPGSTSPVPPPPPTATPIPPPPRQATPSPAPAPSWQADSSWQPGQAWQAGANAPAAPPTQPYQQPSAAPGSGAWQAGPSTAPAFAPTPAATRQGRNPLVLIVAGVAVGLFVVSLFALDWAPSLTYGNLRTLVNDRDVSGVADNLAKMHMTWLGYAWVALAIVAFGVFVVGKVASHRVGHVLAALAAAIGAVLATFVIVRLFRGPDDPEFGVWLLPAGYLVLLAAVVVSSLRESN